MENISSTNNRRSFHLKSPNTISRPGKKAGRKSETYLRSGQFASMRVNERKDIFQCLVFWLKW